VRQINVAEAKAHLSALIAAAERGEEVVIARDGRPAVRLVPIERRPRRAGFARDLGPIRSTDDFDAPLEDFDEYSR
jgi:prevent-host-death family protein